MRCHVRCHVMPCDAMRCHAMPRFQRFYFRKSFAEFEVRALAMASLTLASKLLGQNCEDKKEIGSCFQLL